MEKHGAGIYNARIRANVDFKSMISKLIKAYTSSSSSPGLASRKVAEAECQGLGLIGWIVTRVMNSAIQKARDE